MHRNQFVEHVDLPKVGVELDAVKMTAWAAGRYCECRSPCPSTTHPCGCAPPGGERSLSSKFREKVINVDSSYRLLCRVVFLFTLHRVQVGEIFFHSLQISTFFNDIGSEVESLPAVPPVVPCGWNLLLSSQFVHLPAVIQPFHFNGIVHSPPPCPSNWNPFAVLTTGTTPRYSPLSQPVVEPHLFLAVMMAFFQGRKSRKSNCTGFFHLNHHSS